MNYIKITNNEQTFYFTSKTKAAEFIGCKQQNINTYITKGYKAKGWIISETDQIDERYLDPESDIQKEIKSIKEDIIKLINKLQKIYLHLGV